MWDFKCITAALCFLTSNILFIVHGALLMKYEHENNHNNNVAGTELARAYWKELDPSYIQTIWAQRESQRPLLMCAAVRFCYIFIENKFEVCINEYKSCCNLLYFPPLSFNSFDMHKKIKLFGAMAWFWMIPPVVQSAWILSRGGKRLVGLHMLLATVSFGILLDL